MAPRPVVTLYSRPGCHLCEEARGHLQRLAPDLGFDISEVNIEADDALLARYVFEIPVVSLEGAELARAPLFGARLEAALRDALRM